MTSPVEASLVRSLDETELRRALAAVATALATELARTDAALRIRLQPVLDEVVSRPLH